MILEFEQSFDPEKVIKQLLLDKAQSNKCGYFNLYVKSKKYHLNFLQLFCNYADDLEIRNYIYKLYKVIDYEEK